MSDGLAQQLVYGSGKGQNTTHYYGGTVDKPKGKPNKKRKSGSKPCK